MATTHDKSWATQADDATERRVKENRPWKNKLVCRGCGAIGTSQYNPLVCDDCLKAAFDVLT